jgi:hypothetical protein
MARHFEGAFAVGFLQSRLVCFFVVGFSGCSKEWRFVLKGPLQSAFCKAAGLVF